MNAEELLQKVEALVDAFYDATPAGNRQAMLDGWEGTGQTMAAGHVPAELRDAFRVLWAAAGERLRERHGQSRHHGNRRELL